MHFVCYYVLRSIKPIKINLVYPIFFQNMSEVTSFRICTHIIIVFIIIIYTGLFSCHLQKKWHELFRKFNISSIDVGEISISEFYYSYIQSASTNLCVHNWGNKNFSYNSYWDRTKICSSSHFGGNLNQKDHTQNDWLTNGDKTWSMLPKTQHFEKIWRANGMKTSYWISIATSSNGTLMVCKTAH